MVVIPSQNQIIPKVPKAETVVENAHRDLTQICRQQQRLLPGFFAGFIALIVGIVLWAAATILAGHSIGWLAIGVGLLVGFTIQFSGQGVDRIFGWLGAVLVLLGCGVGNVFAVCGLAAQAENIPLLSLCASLTPGLAFKLTRQTFNGLDLVFYGLAIYAGYRFSFRRKN